MSARASMLEAMRRSLADSARRKSLSHAFVPELALDHATATPSEPALDRFRRAVEAVGGVVSVVRDEAEAAEAVRTVLESAGARRVAASDAPIVERVMAAVAIDDIRLELAPSRDVLFSCDAGVTSAQWAIVETGTLALDSDAERHRLASLVPPVHVAIVESSQLRETLGELLREASERGAAALPRALTLVTGPSRTSDIELTLAIGVHGPGVLHVVVVDRSGV